MLVPLLDEKALELSVHVLKLVGFPGGTACAIASSAES
jgi:hypothetical protein